MAGMVVKNNMSAINTLNTLNKNHSALAKSLQKVSSGMRINSAADDASGYAISERMRVQIRSLDQDNRNTQNGNSMMKVAEGAVSSTVEILKTLKEKVINAANDTNTDSDRQQIQKELDQSIDQINDNANVTYNGKYLVDGSHNRKVNASGNDATPEGTKTHMTNESMLKDTTWSSKLVDLKTRSGDALNIHTGDTVTVSIVAEGKTFPVAIDENGKVIMTNTGVPKHLAYYYGDTEYEFKGGDAIYEDVNHDGNINELDIKYLGNSLPKMQGGFNVTLQYENWKLVARFNYRWGNKIINTARMGLESMFGTQNQCSSVTYRWRKDGDVTEIPRALYGTGYNYQVSSRFVEDGSFLRFNNLQISYSLPKKTIKKLGLNSLSAYVTLNNLFCWTKYTGIDPEVASGTYTPASDGATTPRSKSVTASLNFGF